MLWNGTTCSSLTISFVLLSQIIGDWRPHFSPEVLVMDCKARGTIWGILWPSSEKHVQRQGVGFLQKPNTVWSKNLWDLLLNLPLWLCSLNLSFLCQADWISWGCYRALLGGCFLTSQTLRSFVATWKDSRFSLAPIVICECCLWVWASKSKEHWKS